MSENLEVFGSYDVAVVGAGITGVIAAIAAARDGAKTLLIEGSGNLGGMVTGGRLSRPNGVVNGGIFRELLEGASILGGADTRTHAYIGGHYTGFFDPGVMQRMIIEALDTSNVEPLLYAQTVGVLLDDGRVVGVRFRVKNGERIAFSKVTIDASGDGDVAALAGARFMLGRDADGKTQPITNYIRILNVDIPKFAEYCRTHPEDMRDLHLPEKEDATNEDVVLQFNMIGLMHLIKRAEDDGFKWILPKDYVTIKAGMIPGEVNINATRVQGNALDERVRTRALLEIMKQAFNCFDFLKKYVPGFENSIFLETAPVIGVRETRRIVGDYILTEHDVRNEARFEDAIGLSNCPMDTHQPGGRWGLVDPVGSGYGIPYRCLLPAAIEGLLVAGRCISADTGAFASSRNTPACAVTGEAAGIAASIAAHGNVTPRNIPLTQLQQKLRDANITLGVPQDNATLNRRLT